MSSTRGYRMTARADAVAAMRERIVAAGVALAFDDLVLEPSLGQVAAAARTTPQTVLRHFGSRGELLAEVERAARAVILAERTPASGGVNRGCAYWSDGQPNGLRRILHGTSDGRLFSLDARTGLLDAHFAQGGVLDLRAGLDPKVAALPYGPTSAPAACSKKWPPLLTGLRPPSASWCRRAAA